MGRNFVFWETICYYGIKTMESYNMLSKLLWSIRASRLHKPSIVESHWVCHILCLDIHNTYIPWCIGSWFLFIWEIFFPLLLASPNGTHSPRHNSHRTCLMESFLPAQSSSFVLCHRLDFTFLCSLRVCTTFPLYCDPVFISASHATQSMTNLCQIQFFH